MSLVFSLSVTLFLHLCLFGTREEETGPFLRYGNFMKYTMKIREGENLACSDPPSLRVVNVKFPLFLLWDLSSSLNTFRCVVS